MMTTAKLLWQAWSWEPDVLISIALLVAAYFVLSKFRFERRTWLFLAGIFILLLALESPIGVLGEEDLFSFHMLQHLMLVLVVAPLWLAGIPPGWWQRLLSWAPAARLENILGNPIIALLLYVGILWGWHVPAFYDAAVRSEPVHTLEHVSFLIMAVIFWWPIIAQPQNLKRMSPLGSSLYLFVAAAADAVLGIIITFASPVLYPVYLDPTDTHHFLPFLQQTWGLTTAVDQQLGGLLMWIPGGLVYLMAILATLSHWFNTPEDITLITEDR